MRYQFTREDCVKGGKARATQESFPLACSAGFWACCEKHPFYARKYLKNKIKAFYADRQNTDRQKGTEGK